jgi:hypothetical protein
MKLATCAGHRVSALTKYVLVGTIAMLSACASSHTSSNDDAQPTDAVVAPADADTRLPFGEPCTDGSQCSSAYCLTDPPNPGFCTKECMFDCPRGYACETVDINGTQNRLCVKAKDTFCQTCTASDDCGDDYDNCVQLTDGKFCSKDCSNDPTVCPSGFTCQVVGGGGGDLSLHQCMPLNGVCCIDADNDRHGIGGDCLDTDCDDHDPVVFKGHAEICDSKDNDCNTQVDDNPIDCKGPLCELGQLGYYARVGDICNGVTCVQQPALMCGLYTCDGGGEDGDICAPLCDLEVDTKCIPSAHCDASTCHPDVVDGTACDEDSDCQSNHCQNGFCCAHGDCCQQADQCPGFGTFTPTCDDPSTCQGARGEAVCNANSICSTNGMVQDDSACTGTTIANDCGFYKAVTCTGGLTQTAPTCPTSCVNSNDCDGNAWCNPSNHTCQEDLDDGNACGTDDDRCKSGHCGNGFCCGAGDCCATAQDCPGAYSSAPTCTSPTACDGEADVAVCGNHECATQQNVDDDSACTGTTVASTCGPYKSIFCTGSATQTAPDCPTSCTSDSDCDTNAYCNVAGHCVLDEPDGNACTGGQQCQSAHCQNGYCCGAGDCCATDGNCDAYDKAPVCDSVATCQGTRKEGVCNAAKECGAPVTVDDDSGCAGITANDCGPYPAVQCTAMQAQSAPVCSMMCGGDGDCDISAHCNPTTMMCEPDQGQGGFCTRPQDCGSGLSCVDSVCCNTSCNGGCEACDLPGHVGDCTKVPDGQDPDNECGGVSCVGFYYGFSGSSCQRKADVPANVASCGGTGTCRTQATECSNYNVAGPVTLTCNGSCQTPTGSTCIGQVAGQCTNINPGTTTCGQGICQRTVNQCVNGSPNTCVPGAPGTETCNNLDDNCDGTIDNGNFSDSYEPNPDCGSVRTLGAVGSDGSNTYTSMTIYAAGDYDYYAIPMNETDNSCSCGFPWLDEDYTASVTLTVPAGAGSYEFCMNTNSCGWPAGYCFEVAAGGTTTLSQNLDGACPGSDNYTVYVRIHGDNAPGFQCHPYTLSYFFDAGYCR